MKAFSEVPYATFAIKGQVSKLHTRQSNYLLASDTWYLQFHSLTIFNIPDTVDEVFSLNCNLIQSNRRLERELVYTDKLSWSWEQYQPLFFFPLKTDKNTHGENKVMQLGESRNSFAHVTFPSSVKFEINNKKNILELYLHPQSGRQLPDAFYNCEAIIHCSLFKQNRHHE